MTDPFSPERQLNLNVRGLGVSPTLRINELSAELKRQGKQVYRLGLGQSPFPVPACVERALVANAAQKDYLPVRGLQPLREAVAAYHRRMDGVDRTAEDVLIGPGSKELMFLLQLVYYGHLVIPTPSWVSYAPQAHILGRQVHWLETKRESQWRLSADDFERYCASDPNAPRIVILNYPNNPTGGAYTEESLKEFAEVARKYRLLLLSDEIYSGLHHQGNHVSIARYYPEGTIISGGISKWCGAGGWRLGTFIFPPKLRWLLDAMAAVASETYTSTSAPIQFAAIRAFQDDSEMEAYLSGCRRILSALGDRLYRMLKKAKIVVPQPMGAFYLFPDFTGKRRAFAKRGIHSSRELCERLLLETGVAILPGCDFGRPKDELSARIAYVNFDGGQALAALAAGRKADAAFLETYCGESIQAVQLIIDWVARLE